MDMLFFVKLFLLFTSSIYCHQCPEHQRLLCHEQINCASCLKVNPCCNWCYNKNYTATRRCDFVERHSECGIENLELNQFTTMEIVKNQEFSNIQDKDDVLEVSQIRPQLVNLVLRIDEPVNITFTYKAAKNFPLELYYLGDLSYSMKEDLDTLKHLGDSINIIISHNNLRLVIKGSSLSSLTKQYKLAFGSFLDKPEMPYAYTEEVKRKNPCRVEDDFVCDETYLFRHSLNFTSDIDEFFEKVKGSKISANLDDLDGALEAIHQIVVCQSNFGWTKQSRKIIVLSTDSLLHVAGDGLLGGASLVNSKELCLVDNLGMHTNPLTYDYPSLGEIKDLLKRYKTNLIVAVTKDKIQHYNKMKSDVLKHQAYIGELEQHSSNILQLVKEGFYDFIRQVEFSVNITEHPELQVRLFADCDRLGVYRETTGCQNIEEDVPVDFKLQVTLHSDNVEELQKLTGQLLVRERNIDDVLEINIDYIAELCRCLNYRDDSPVDCNHGIKNCGTCNCEQGWKNESCSEQCKDDTWSCRKSENSGVCSRKGDCTCGKCKCENGYTGSFCEFECPKNEKGICSGQGTCFEGVCQCKAGYSKDACECEVSTDKCRLNVDHPICNGKGECVCNECKCKDEHNGQYCEHKGTSTNYYCDSFNPIIEAHFNTSNTTSVHQTPLPHILIENRIDDNVTVPENTTCEVIAYEPDRCTNHYFYLSTNNTVKLVVYKKDCAKSILTAQTGYIALVAFATIVLMGLIGIIIHKWQIVRQEKEEYDAFVNKTKQFRERGENPLYVSPVTSYDNPMRRSGNNRVSKEQHEM